MMIRDKTFFRSCCGELRPRVACSVWTFSELPTAHGRVRARRGRGFERPATTPKWPHVREGRRRARFSRDVEHLSARSSAER
jgi:hypothetical protein